MKLFVKILLFVFAVLIANVKVTSATTTVIDIQKVTTSFSFHKEMPKTVVKVIEYDLGKCCQSGLKVGRDGFSYLTNARSLLPLQAQIELALPANRAPLPHDCIVWHLTSTSLKLMRGFPNRKNSLVLSREQKL